MTDRFYYKYDELEDHYEIVESGGGCEHGQYYDIVHFYTATMTDADDAVYLLNKLYKETQEK